MLQSNILFDNRWAGKHGIGRFCQEVLRGLGSVNTINSGPQPSNPLDSLWLTQRLRGSGSSLFFSPGYNFPLLSKIPFVMTIHDLNHIDIPDNSSCAKKTYYNLFLKKACKRSRLIFTVSEYSRERILGWSKVSNEKVVNVGNGVSSCFSPKGLHYSSERPYFVYVGNSKPHKNVCGMIKAFIHSKASKEFELILIGPDPKYISRLFAGAVPNNIKCLSGINDDLLAQIYRGAKGLILVSKYEGFGLPVVEAMACGTPVIVSKIPVFKEVTGGNACFVSNYDMNSIASGIDKIAYEGMNYSNLSSAGLQQASCYSWDNVRKRVKESLARIF